MLIADLYGIACGVRNEQYPSYTCNRRKDHSGEHSYVEVVVKWPRKPGLCSMGGCEARATEVVMFDSILHPPGEETPCCWFHYGDYKHIGYTDKKVN
jgi:hypothetical protein